MAKDTTTWKRLSVIGLILLLIVGILKIVAYYQTKYVLVSPLISKSTIEEITKGYLPMAGICLAALLAGSVFHYSGKYKLVVILSLATIIGTDLYLEFSR